MTKTHAKNYLEVFTDKSINALEFIINDNSKGDLIKKVLKLDDRIKTIDSAIPYDVQKSLIDLGIKADMYVTVYYGNNFVETVNIIEHLTILIKGL